MEISIKFSLVAIFFLWTLQFCASLGEDLPIPSFGPMVIAKESRRTLVSTDSGSITAVDVQDRYRGLYRLQFITLDSSSLLLPVILHTDIVFYVHSGRGAVNWITEDRTNRIDVRRGDIYRLEEGTVFYVESHPDPLREKLRIHAIFNTMLDENPSEGFVGAYSNIIDLVRGFDDEVLRMAFGVSEEVIQGIKGVERPPPIVHYEPRNETDEVDWREGIFEALIGGRHPTADGKKKKKKKEKMKTLNLVDRKPDIENCNGRSVAVTSKEFKPLKGSDIGIFMVNLTKGSMMGPHWNPKATEIAIVTHGQGIVQVVCPSKASGASSEDFRCQNTKFIKVKEGDIFIVPRYHPMVQISFNNDSFVFVGFTTTASQNHPQFLAGKRSVLRTIDRKMLGRSFNAANTTIDHLLDSQMESVTFECATCAEELEEKIQRKREEEEARKREEEEEARKREEEERKREEEEEARRREEEEEARKREEEEARKREEEEARKREEEEEARKREEEEARKREEEEARKREEEEERRREEEQRKEEEEMQKRQEEEARRQEEEEEARRREEEEARKREEEEARKREEEEQRRREEEEEARKREEEEERRREEEEGRRKEEEEQRKEEEEMQKRQEEEEEARRQQEEEVRRQEEEATRREEEEEEARRREEAQREEEEGQEQGEAAAKKTEEQQKQMHAGEEEQEKQTEEEPAIS